MSETLTPQQKQAVENRGGNLLVSAAAGSGKTKVLVDRLMSYLLDPVTPKNLDDFLIITYTKAAASELRGKISDKLTKYISEHPDNKHMQKQIQRLYLAKISTVHAFCADILREYAYRLDIAADFRIAEESECHELMYQALHQVLDEAYSNSLDEHSFRAFVDTQGLGRDDRQIPEIILQIYASALCHLDPNGWMEWCLKAADVTDISDAAETVWGKFLISDLKKYISWQIQSLDNCIRAALDIPGLEKPVTLLKKTVVDLQMLMECHTWDEIADFPPIEYGTLTFKKDHKDTQLAQQIKAVRNACKEGVSKKLRTFSDSSSVVLKNLGDSAIAAEGLINLVKAFRIKYDSLKRSRRILDFSDIEQKTLDLLVGKHRTGFTSAAEEISTRYCEIMVDEYQDSNEVQDAIFSALTHKRNNCFMVGDVKQSIYQFRLADPGIFLQKYNTYSSAENAGVGEGRKVLLCSNFRSSNGVISAVNDVFTKCMSSEVGGLHYSEDEQLHEGIPHIPLNEPEVELYGIDVQADTYEEEAAFTAQRIAKLLDGSHMVRDGNVLRPIELDDIVILLRSPGSVGAEFRFALESAGIPCTMGADADLLQAPEIEILRAILQIIHNPLQDIPMIAALLSPVFGFTANDVALIRGKSKYVSLYHALKNSDHEKAEHFLSLLSVLRMDARFMSATQLIHQIFIRTGMLSVYGAMPEGKTAAENLQSFCQIAANYESTGRKDLSYFLDYLSAMDEKGMSISGTTSSNAVRIMSIHKSKGLEFPVVFLCGLSRGFNTADTQKQVLCHKALGLGLNNINEKQRVRFPTIAKRAISLKISTDSISEELRVLYVAMTRARDRLIMTYAAKNLQNDLLDIVLRMDMCPKELLHTGVDCPGSWILSTALQRTEAGEFFHIAEKPFNVSVQDNPWSIHVVQVSDSTHVSGITQEPTSEQISDISIEKIRKGLSFTYPHTTETQIPSKLTATQMKGRAKDQEIAEFSDQPQISQVAFRSVNTDRSKLSGTEYGNAIHLAMQHIRFENCNSFDEVQMEIQRIYASGLITKEQMQAIDTEKIHRFFVTEIGRELLASRNVLREFKFSILDDANKYYPISSNDKILLQGVIDCALIKDDSITILDFKTDYITESNLQSKIDIYRNQVLTYANAMSKIYEQPVVKKYLYFFSNSQLVEVE